MHYNKKPWTLVRGFLFLEGENERYSKDPFSHSNRGDHDGSFRDGITKIDDLTDMKDYLNLLTYLVSDTAVPVTDLLQILEDFDLSSTGDAICSPALGLYDLKRNIPNIANFNMRHREGRNMTQEEADHETARVIHGVMRVAQKIRGNFVPPAASVEHESIPPSAL